MSKEKQIEEMARDIFAPKVAIDGIDIAFAAVHGADKPDSHFMRIAQHLYNAGYRKQSEGEWHMVSDYTDSRIVECSKCDKQFYFKKKGQLNIDKMSYCPNCGANMKGGE